jgi:surfeit locus 1 family protein
VKQPTFWQVALRARWIGALFLALALAAGFAALGQWQLERTFVPAPPVSLPIDKATVSLDTSNVYVVENRLQHGQLGYWVISNSTDMDGKSLTLALGWTADLAKAEKVRVEVQNSIQVRMLIPIQGYLFPSEAPQPINASKPYLLKSLSLAQLVNLYAPDRKLESATQFMAVQPVAGALNIYETPDLQPITIDAGPGGTEVNWLTAFYAIEWTVFAGFAVFLWWRLVRDAQIREQAER